VHRLRSNVRGIGSGVRALGKCHTGGGNAATAAATAVAAANVATGDCGDGKAEDTASGLDMGGKGMRNAGGAETDILDGGTKFLTGGVAAREDRYPECRAAVAG
jgi:carbohydrate-selective porin OprB